MHRFARVVASSAFALILPSCMPWLAGGRTEPLARGAQQFSFGTAAVVPPDIGDVLPVPQLRFRKSMGGASDFALEYAFPATLGVSAAHWWRSAGTHLGALAGGGAHALPGVFGARTVPLFPFAQLGAIAARASRHHEFIAVRAFAPFQTRGDFAATLWLVANAGAEWRWQRLRIAPEIGGVMTSTHPEDVLLIGGISFWLTRPGAARLP